MSQVSEQRKYFNNAMLPNERLPLTERQGQCRNRPQLFAKWYGSGVAAVFNTHKSFRGAGEPHPLGKRKKMTNER
jgi:hypothetical protein